MAICLQNMDATDLELLERYAIAGAEDAFSEIVRRHLNLVYSAALRQVRLPQLAEEAAQSVFIDLARSARRLAPDAVVSGWLYQVTRRTAIDIVRREARRKMREQTASEMNAMNPAAQDWAPIGPMLDEAMASLCDADRDAILLRFFENKTLREVGQLLHTSEDAAQKRVSRAIERLRDFFARRGVTMNASAIPAVLAANAVLAAPAGLSAAITSAVLAGAITTATIATKTAMTWIKLKSVTVAAASAFLTVTGTYLTMKSDANRLLSQNQGLMAQREQAVHERDLALAAAAARLDELERLRKNELELMRLRGEVGQLRQQLNEQTSKAAAAAPKQTPRSAGHAPGAYVAKDQLVNAGYATPEAALETLTWAMMHGTYEQVLEAMGPDVRSEESKDPNSREKFETGQKRMAPLLKGLQIVAQKALADGKVELKVKMDRDPMPNQPVTMPSFYIQPMVREGDAWKLGGSTRGHREDWEQSGQVQAYAP